MQTTPRLQQMLEVLTIVVAAAVVAIGNFSLALLLLETG
jgi:hypothetical protein